MPSLYRSQKYIKQPSLTPDRSCLSCSTATTVSATATTDTHTTDCVCPVSQLPQTLTPQTVSVLCHSYHRHSHHRLCLSCVTATTVTHTTDCVCPVPQLPQSLTPQTVSVLCNSYHSHSHHTVTQQTTFLLFHGQNNDTSHSYCHTTDHVHPLDSHNRHSIILLRHRPCPSSRQPQSSFYHTATPQTMLILSAATIVILSYCYATDHAHPLGSHNRHSIILLRHRPCPSSRQPQSSFYHTATPQTMPILSTATIVILSYCYATDHAHPLDSHNRHSIILLRHRPCPSSRQPQSSFYNTATPQTMPILSTATVIVLSYCYTTDHAHHSQITTSTPNSPITDHAHHIISLTLITTRIMFCGSEKGA